jgi:hypothetical protein
VGQKLVPIYEAAYQQTLDTAAYQPMIEMIAEWAHDQRFQDEGYKRLFVQKLVEGLHFLRKQGQAPTRHDLSLT